MRMKKVVLLCTIAASMLLITTSLSAQTTPPDGCPLHINGKCINPLITAVPFLRIIPDARTAALGDAGIGASADPNAMHINSSKLVFADSKFAMAGSYSPWLRSLGLTDVFLAYLSGYYKLDQLQTLGVGMRYFSLGNISFTDESGNPIRDGKPREFELSLGYSRLLAENFSAGINGKFIYSNLAAGQVVESTDIFAGTAFAADLSLTYRKPIKMGETPTVLTLGAAFTNIGSKITYTKSINKDFLPANMGIGAGWEFNLDEHNSLTLLADFNKLLVPTPTTTDADGNGRPDYRDKSPIAGILGSFSDAPGGFSEEMREFSVSSGIEYWYDKQFALRAGYYYEDPTKGNRQFLTAGLGVKYNVFSLNFSYLVPTTNQRNPLDNTLRFTFLFDIASFNKSAEAE
ncbi:MAG: type IX secretion system outer membrane channel protein PorV [Saprospiraceae bacterium]|nr:type IX secretion system outer membrane channel protein PorV [Saprospiraceae bacterium]